MSDANKASLAFKLSASAAAAYQLLRYTGEDLQNTKDTVQSQEIRSDGQVPDLVMVGSQPEGGFNFELSYRAFQPFFAGALRNEWVVTAISIASTMTASTQTVTAAAGTFDDVPLGSLVNVTGAVAPGNNGPKRIVGKANDGSTLVFAPGSITVDAISATHAFSGKSLCNSQDKVGFDFEKRIINSAGADYYLRYLGMVCDSMELNIESKKIVTGSMKFIGMTNEISATGADAGAVSPVKATGTLTLTGNAVADETVTINGVVYTWKTSADEAGEVTIGGSASVSIDNLIAEINGDGFAEANEDVIASAGAGDTMTLTAIEEGTQGNDITTVEVMTNATFGGATLTGGVTQVSGYDQAETGSIFNAASNMGTIMMDGAVATDKFKSIKLAFGNNVRGKDALGIVGNFDTGLGTFVVTGTLNAYFNNTDLPAKIKAHTSFGLSFYLQDAEGNQLHFYMPNTKPAKGDPAVTAINTDVMIETAFQAIMDQAVTGKTLFIDALDD
jgi:hypothetical protein